MRSQYAYTNSIKIIGTFLFHLQLKLFSTFFLVTVVLHSTSLKTTEDSYKYKFLLGKNNKVIQVLVGSKLERQEFGARKNI